MIERRLDQAPPILCLAGFVAVGTIGAFAGGSWAAIAIALAVLLTLSVWRQDRRFPRPDRGAVWLALATLAIFALALPLSSQPRLSRHLWLQLASVWLPLLMLTSTRLQQAAAPPRLIPVAALAMAAGAAALGCELADGGYLLHAVRGAQRGLTDYNRGAAHLVILAFPIAAGLWATGRRGAMAALGLLLLLPASLTESHTAKLALLLGAAAAALGFWRPVRVRATLTALALLIAGWPFYAQRLFASRYDQVEQLHPSWRHRIEIWDYLSYRIMERPWAGWGLGSTPSLDFRNPHGALYQIVRAAAPHAHNFITQVEVETGLTGLVLLLAFLLLTLRAAARLHPALRPFGLGGWLAAVTVGLFGFDFWTDALWAAFALSAFAFGIMHQRLEGAQHGARL